MNIPVHVYTCITILEKEEKYLFAWEISNCRSCNNKNTKDWLKISVFNTYMLSIATLRIHQSIVSTIIYHNSKHNNKYTLSLSHAQFDVHCHHSSSELSHITITITQLQSRPLDLILCVENDLWDLSVFHRGSIVVAGGIGKLKRNLSAWHRFVGDLPQSFGSVVRIWTLN